MPTATTRAAIRTTPTLTPTRTTPASALARCIEPVATGEFHAGHWERRPLLVPRDEPGRFDDLLAVADVERLVCSGALRFPALRLVKEGARIDVGSYTADLPWRPVAFTDTIDVERVLGEFEAGATIVLQGLHLNWSPLAAFCRSLESELGHGVQANAYFTPRDSQGLAVHHDTHDVFVLQTGGEKRWLVYEPVLELPLKQQRYSPGLGAPGETVLDCTLRPGDTLYLPRGWLHQAVTSATDSLHVTVGVNVYSRLDAMRAALDDCAEDVDFRRSADSDGEFDDLVERLAARLGREDVSRRMRRRLVRSRRPILDDQLTQLQSLGTLTVETAVERRPLVSDLAVSNSAVALSFNGKTVTFPGHVRADLEYVAAAAEPFSPDELPGELDDESRLVLVRRLVREGFLRITPGA